MVQPSTPPRGRADTAATSGRIRVNTVDGGYEVTAAEGREILIGREGTQVHLQVGGDDPGVSRRHVVLRHRDGRWWVFRTGRRDVHLGTGRRLWSGPDDGVPLDPGHTTVLISGSAGRVHAVEIRITGPDRAPDVATGDRTLVEAPLSLSTDERLAMVAIAERYLRGEPHARPRSWQEAATSLTEVVAGRDFSHKQVERLGTKVRQRLADRGHDGLFSAEVTVPGELLKHNLITLLIASNSIGPADLTLIDPPEH